MNSNMADKFLSAETVERYNGYALDIEVRQDYKMLNPRLKAQAVFVGQDMPIFASLADVTDINDLIWSYFDGIGAVEHWYISSPVYTRFSNQKEFSITPYPVSEGNMLAGFMYIPTKLAMKLVGKDRFKKTHRGEADKLFADELVQYNEWLAGRFVALHIIAADGETEVSSGHYVAKGNCIDVQANILLDKWLDARAIETEVDACNDELQESKLLLCDELEVS